MIHQSSYHHIHNGVLVVLVMVVVLMLMMIMVTTIERTGINAWANNHYTTTSINHMSSFILF